MHLFTLMDSLNFEKKCRSLKRQRMRGLSGGLAEYLLMGTSKRKKCKQVKEEKNKRLKTMFFSMFCSLWSLFQGEFEEQKRINFLEKGIKTSILNPYCQSALKVGDRVKFTLTGLPLLFHYTGRIMILLQMEQNVWVFPNCNRSFDLFVRAWKDLSPY